MKEAFCCSLIPLLILLLFKLNKGFQMLQQNWYNDSNRYLKWIKRNPKKVFVSLELGVLLIYLLGFFIPSNILMYIYVVYCLIMVYLYRRSLIQSQSKKPLIYTKRIWRLLFTTMMIYIASFLLILFINYDDNLIFCYYLIMSMMVYFSYFIIYIANIINIPLEKLIYFYYRMKATKKLKSQKMEVIGITGSYGKTSSKNIIYDMLSIKYNTFKTPKNFNTAYGLINTVNNYLDKFCNYFIAEMGATKKGEIKTECNIIKPKYGVITKIGTAHLESFGSEDAIEKTKFELIESLPDDGLAILNGDDAKQVNHKVSSQCTIMWIGIENKETDVYADNIKLSHKGTTFDVHFKGDKNKYSFETKLLGKFNVYNILIGILLGKYFGIEIEKLQIASKRIEPVEHRLQLKKVGKINIIDDAYNSNPVGSKMAVEVLGLMPGTKIIVTPGMIELGSEQFNLNKLFGTYIAKNADYVILVGEQQTKPIYEGLIESKFNKDKIHIINDVKKAFPLINELSRNETYVLLENDLPDIFNE